MLLAPASWTTLHIESIGDCSHGTLNLIELHASPMIPTGICLFFYILAGNQNEVPPRFFK